MYRRAQAAPLSSAEDIRTNPTFTFWAYNCRNAVLKSVELNRKYMSVADAQKRWNEGRESDAKLDPDDWRVALVKNDAAMRKLLALYAGRYDQKLCSVVI